MQRSGRLQRKSEAQIEEAIQANLEVERLAKEIQFKVDHAAKA